VDKIPFTTYDFWAYLSSGFLLLFIVDVVGPTDILAKVNWSFVQIIVAVSAAYAVGHIVAHLSSLLLERGLVEKVLGPPRAALFGHPRAPRWIRALLPGYFKALPNEIAQNALARAKAAGVSDAGQAMFQLAFHNARNNPVVLARIDNFLNLYGFCRNIALVCLIDAAILYANYRWFRGPDDHYWWSLVALVMGIGMVARYLKFFRHFSYEIFTAYGSESPAPNVHK